MRGGKLAAEQIKRARLCVGATLAVTSAGFAVSTLLCKRIGLIRRSAFFFFVPFLLALLTCELKTVTIPSTIYMYTQTFNMHLIHIVMHACVCTLRGLCCGGSWFCKCSHLYCLTLA